MIQLLPKPMKATPYSRTRTVKSFEKLLVQPKYDGIRATFEKGALYSYDRLEIFGVPEITEYLRSLSISTIPDGELYSDTLDFDTLSGVVRRRSNNLSPLRDQVHFVVFDLIVELIDNFQRATWVGQMSPIFDPAFVRTSPTYQIPNKEERIQYYLNSFIDKGYEGIILRNPKALYEFKRSTQMYKIKPFKSDIYKIVGFKEEISKDGIPKGRLGSFILIGEEGVRFNASGIEDSIKEKVWANPEFYLGKMVKVKYQRKTTKGRRRHANFISFVENIE